MDETLGLIYILLEAGFDVQEIREYLEEPRDDFACQCQMTLLQKYRKKLLSDIHHTQQVLDKVDYIIWEKKQNQKIEG